MEVASEGHGRLISEAQKSLELRKFFAPRLQTRKAQGFDKDSLSGDGALAAYAETVVWRLKGVHAMVSLIDRSEQYFIAGANRVDTDDEGEVSDTTSWFGCSSVPTPGGLCENTLAVGRTDEKYPCFIINDLSRDARFASLPVVNGEIAAYRFYAGTPITTSQGVNIGSFFIFDNRPRAGLTTKERSFLWHQAGNVMRHLETRREAAERRRVALMSKGISDFLVRTSRVAEDPDSAEPTTTNSQNGSSEDYGPEARWTNADGDDAAPRLSQRGSETVLDKIRLTLDLAAEVLQESLELNVGGVAFFDTTISYTDTGAMENVNEEAIGTSDGEFLNRNAPIQFLSRHHDRFGRHLSKSFVRSSADKHKPAKVQAASTAEEVTFNKSRVLDGQTLQSLINSYPKGNVWYIDDGGYFSSLEQITELEAASAASPSGRRRSTTTIDLTQQNAEANLLSEIFNKARQIIFLPIWDAGGDRWYSGCFAWSQASVPVFTMENDVAYLLAFTNSVMVEISRLDAITSNKMKSDFISSISHEFRSPLHGILASSEFLRDSSLDASQIEFISTIQNCSGTLLDTINHVLDYSKINSFEKVGNQQAGTISNELFQTSNLALLSEDLINGMIAASEWGGSTDPSVPLTSSSSRQTLFQPTHRRRRDAVEIIMDIEYYDWEFRVQAGALRRVIMNIFGNAQKYTESGYILVEDGVREASTNRYSKPAEMTREVLMIHVRDSGRGMSSEYMERKLYHPFAQEDSFAPGIGLGLSIVWSIINQLGGKIHIRSEPGKGTDVEITLPVDRPDGSEAERLDDLVSIQADTQEAITNLRARAAGRSLLIARRSQESELSRHKDVSWNCIERYCVDWFGYQVIKWEDWDLSTVPDLVITDHDEDWVDSSTESQENQRVLIIHEHMIARPRHRQGQQLVGTICTPIGPFKLARCLLDLLAQDPSNPKASNTSDVGTQTPAAEERVQGVPMTDYGFTVPMLSPKNQPASILEVDSLEQKGVHSENSTLPEAIKKSLPLPMDPKSTPPPDEEVQQALASMTSLSLRLPTHRPKRKQAASPSPTLSRPTASNSAAFPTANTNSTNMPLHILAVDDNALNLQLIHRYLLKRKSDTIVTARNGVEAVAAVSEAAMRNARFDVIFMDISMPEMDGFEATRLIRSFERSERHTSFSEQKGRFGLGNGDAVAENENIPSKRASGGLKGFDDGRAHIVALTGLASRRDRDQAESSGFDDFLTKPIAFGKIGEVLKKLSTEKSGRTKTWTL